MGRLPFDPAKMRGAQPPPAPSPGPKRPDGVLSVSALASMIRAVLEQHLPDRLRVVGEVSGAKRSTHLYFALKDSGALINAIAFASSLRKLGFEPRDGQEVLVTGRVEYYGPQGRLTLIAEKIEPVGEGAHELRFRQLCEELRALGWFDPARKRPLPVFPRRVAVVTSRTGAAIQDVLATMAKRCPAVGVALFDVRVQGETAAAEVAAAIRNISSRHERLGVDAVIVTRGGGSPEDLAAFNDRELARAIVECEVPVVAAIGHETDTSIAELVADERCATPTQAAMRLTPDTAALERQLDALAGRLRLQISRAVTLERQRLRAASRHPVLADPRGATRIAARQLAHLATELQSAADHAAQRARRRLDAASLAAERRQPRAALAHARATHNAYEKRLARALHHGLAQRHAALAALAGRLDSIGPAATLRRGYSCTRRADGAVVRDPADVSPGDRVTTHLARGSFDSDVVHVRSEASPAPSSPTPASPVVPARPTLPRRRPRPGEPPDQLDLFGGGG